MSLVRAAASALSAAAATGLLLASCSQGVTATPGSPGSSPSGKTALTIAVRLDQGQPTTTWRLTCEPPGGDHPDPAAACAALDQSGRTVLPPVAKDMACTEVFGGPQTAEISGTWRGQPVDSRLSRANGCEIARWDALKPLLEA